MPPELYIAWMCKRYGMSPNEVLETDQMLLNRMNIYDSAYESYRSFHNIPAGQGASWQQGNPEAWKIVTEILKWQPND